ncbi:probable serine/threonine-protein kinase pats1 isoform X2 [Mercenaria mercenaria]|uniref:probable serine/threonine-protein kinase pats1 isoform X2 n=1 Tax=Mercenaria mercenaria TaxID=6596 RepID=UPI00234E4369|nr:probable serine/threonine-protein kinase pats1 isoform X2 [Mercenaria mercenaria]
MSVRKKKQTEKEKKFEEQEEGEVVSKWHPQARSGYQPRRRDAFSRSISPPNLIRSHRLRYTGEVPDEIEKTPYYVDLYHRSLQYGMTNDRSIRVNIVGNFGQGKTTLVRRLTERNLDGIEVTNGIDLAHFICEREYWGKLKYKREEEMVSRHQDTVYNMDIWDFGGQYIYYATHTLFHSKRAVYLLVVNLDLDLKDVIKDEDFPTQSGERNMEYFVKFWMNSIHSFIGSENGHEPPVIIVGTHKDLLMGNSETERQLKADEYFDNIRQLFDNTEVRNHIRTDFAIDNTNEKDESIERLRETIYKTGKTILGNFQIPKSWMVVETAIQQADIGKIVKFQRIKDLIRYETYVLESNEQIKLFLQYCHAKGTLIYFDEEPISEYVVLDPQYLINAFKSIITSKRFMKRSAQLRPFWNRLVTEAKLDEEMIDILWRKENFIHHKDILLAFLKKHYIISQATKFDDKTQTSVDLDWYIVPSLLKDHSSQSEIADFLQGKQQSKIRYVLQFGGISVVPTVYHRLIAAILGKWYVVDYKGKNLIYDKLLVFKLDITHLGLIEMKGNDIELAMIYLCPQSGMSTAVADSFRRFVESVISYEFRKLRTSIDDKRKPYSIHYRCNDASHDFQGSMKLEDFQHLKEKTHVPCPDLHTHVIDAYEAKSEWFLESQIFEDLPKRILTDKDLGRFSQAIGKDWQILGPEIGLSRVIIEHITVDYPQSTAMKIFKMLSIWRDRNEDTCTIGNLVMVLKKCKTITVDWDTVRNIIENLN